jgi:hypothetical protein
MANDSGKPSAPDRERNRTLKKRSQEAGWAQERYAKCNAPGIRAARDRGGRWYRQRREGDGGSRRGQREA